MLLKWSVRPRVRAFKFSYEVSRLVFDGSVVKFSGAQRGTAWAGAYPPCQFLAVSILASHCQSSSYGVMVLRSLKIKGYDTNRSFVIQ